RTAVMPESTAFFYTFGEKSGLGGRFQPDASWLHEHWIPGSSPVELAMPRDDKREIPARRLLAARELDSGFSPMKPAMARNDERCGNGTSARHALVCARRRNART
ncbi:MAG: hypothetical protein ACREPF_09920, partial [Rhodanobacteraceae bacterium]